MGLVKNIDEIKKIRESALLVSKTLGLIAKEIKDGITTLEQLREQQDTVLNKVQKVGLQYFDDIQKRIPRGEIDEYKDALASKVDDYLEYVVEEWMKENELAIERGLKGEIAEDFISGLKQLFEDHYIDVPDERYDILEAQSDRIAELEEHINSIMEQNIEMKSTNSDLVREQVILEVSSDLADTEFETFKSLTEDIDFNDEDNFRQKLDTLKESYFPRTGSEETYEIDDEDYGSAVQDIDTTSAMKAYMSAIGRTEKRINGGA